MINQSNAGGLKGLSRAVLTAVIAFIVAIGILQPHSQVLLANTMLKFRLTTIAL